MNRSGKALPMAEPESTGKRAANRGLSPRCCTQVKGAAGSTPLLLACIVASFGFGAATTAVNMVRKGMDHFSAGEFELADEAFLKAEVVEPENATIAFDRACALAASGKAEEARGLYQQAALSRNTQLTTTAHYNLGCLSAEQARTTLGDDPIAAEPKQRDEGISQLLSAVSHYRDCLRIDPDHADARHNLELIRLFIKHIQSQWEERDREKAREELDLLGFLAMIENRQVGLRTATKSFSKLPNSPQTRQAALETAAAQRALCEEIDPLKEKIREQFQQAQTGQPGPGTPPDPNAANSQAQQAERLLLQLADEAGNEMQSAGNEVEESAFDDAVEHQTSVLERLDQIFMIAAPFAKMLQRTTQTQETLVDSSRTATANPAPNRADDFVEIAWRQTRVTNWTRMLQLKAGAQLEALAAETDAADDVRPEDESEAPATEAPDENEQDAPAKTAQPPDPSGKQAAATDQAAQREAFRKSLEKAIELGPAVQEHSESATSHIENKDVAAALPDQEEALRLLEEIAESLPKQDEQQDNQQQDGDKKDDNEEEDGEDDKEDRQQGEQQNQSNDQSQAQRDQDKESRQQDGKTPQERAMSALRRARERQREHRDLQKQLKQIIGGRAEVEKDW